MKKKILYWSPRVLSILFILFISIFALDVFSENYTTLELAVALFMHLLPSFILIVITVVAWKHDFFGGVSFLILGLVFTLMFNTYRDIWSFLIITLPVMLIGFLYIANVKKRRR